MGALLFTAELHFKQQVLDALGLRSGDPVYAWAGVAFTFVEAILVILLTILGARFARHISRSASRNALWDAQLVLLVGRLVYIGVLVLGFLALLEVIAPQLFTPVIGAVGLLGLAFGLAFQDILKNWISGFFLLLERPFRIGDEITVNGQTGRVETVLLRVTVLRTADAMRVLVPNQQVFTSMIIDSSAYPSRQFSAVAALGAERPLEDAARDATSAVRAVPGVASTPAAEVSLVPTVDHGATLEARFWVEVTEHTPRLVQRRVDAALLSVACAQPIELAKIGLGEGASEDRVPDEDEAPARKPRTPRLPARRKA